MTIPRTTGPPPVIPTRALIPFVFLTFAVTWGTIGFFILQPDLAAAWFGAINGTHPAFFLATWGPAIAGLVVVGGYGGAAGLRGFLTRVPRVRCHPGWWLFLILGVPAVFVVGSLLKGGGVVAPIVDEGPGVVLGAAALFLFLGPVEEFGWRGVAQPLLQRRLAPVWAGLIIGATWGVWHLPAFYLAGTLQSGWSFTPFFIGNMALAVLVTPLFNAARGSILLPMIFHFQLVNPIWPDARPWDTWLFSVVAVLVVGLNRASVFTRAGSWTQVVVATGSGRRES